jgi:hypothetical protein
MKNLFTFIFIALCSIVVLNCCKSGGTDPVETYKDPREMTWTIDTLYYPTSMQTALGNLLALNSKDIFAYGHCDDSRGALYRYNGVQWVLRTGATRFNKMIALSVTDIWGFGGDPPDANFLLHFDGNSWKRITLPGVDYPFHDATDDRNGYIYACGSKGLLAAYDLSKWKTEYLNLKVSQPYNFYLSSVGYYDGKLMLNGKSSDGLGREWNYFIVKEGDTYAIKDSLEVWPNKFTWGETGFYKSPWGKYYSYGYGGIWEYSESTWKPYYTPSYAYEYIGSMQGVSENYYFIIKGMKNVVFCRGTEQISIKDKINIDYDNITLGSVWTDGNEVFIAGGELRWPEKTIIIHGK